MKIAGSGSGVRGTDPRIWIRIRSKMSRVPNIVLFMEVIFIRYVQGGVWTSRGAVWHPRLPGRGGSQRVAGIEISRHCARQEEIPFPSSTGIYLPVDAF